MKLSFFSQNMVFHIVLGSVQGLCHCVGCKTSIKGTLRLKAHPAPFSSDAELR